jgi:hypothetical protein
MPTVKEPVLVAMIGVGGVLVGAASSGLVQALLARAELKRDGRNAARVLSMELHDAEKAVSDLRKLRDWTQMITDWDAYAETWAQYRDPLASVLNTSGFAKVAAAFGCLASLKRSHKRDTQNPSPQLAGALYVEGTPVYRRLAGRWPRRKREAQKPPSFDPTDEYLALYLKTVQGQSELCSRPRSAGGRCGGGGRPSVNKAHQSADAMIRMWRKGSERFAKASTRRLKDRRDTHRRAAPSSCEVRRQEREGPVHLSGGH